MKTINVIRCTSWAGAKFTLGEPPCELESVWVMADFSSITPPRRAIVRAVRGQDLFHNTVWWLARQIDGLQAEAPIEQMGAKIVAWCQDASLTGQLETFKEA